MNVIFTATQQFLCLCTVWLSYKVALGSEEAAYTGLNWKVPSGWNLLEVVARQKSRRQGYSTWQNHFVIS